MQCYNCKNEIEPVSSKSGLIIFLLLLTTWFVLWMPLLFYVGLKNTKACPICRAKINKIK